MGLHAPISGSRRHSKWMRLKCSILGEAVVTSRHGAVVDGSVYPEVDSIDCSYVLDKESAAELVSTGGPQT